MKRKIFLSYDVPEALVKEIERQGGTLKERDIWEAIENMDKVHLIEKPVKSTLIIEVETPEKYTEIAATMRKSFPGVFFTIGAVAQSGMSDYYDEVPDSAGSDRELQVFLQEREQEKKEHQVPTLGRSYQIQRKTNRK